MRTTLKGAAAVVALATGMLLSLPLQAFADEGAEEGGAVGAGLLFPGLGEWLPMLIGFIILWAVLARFGWPAFIGMIDRRAETIKDSLERAEAAKVESERILEENRLQLEEARKQATQIIADARQTGEAVRAEVIAQAQEDARLLVEKARGAIEAEKKAAIAQLQGSVADLSVSVVGKVIGRDFTDADHRRLIERYLQEAGNLDAN